MSANLAHELKRESGHDLALRARVLLALGPLTAAAGVVWAFVQPWRLTLLHPQGQGFWWLLAEPPLYVVLVGVLFRLVLAPGIVADLAEAGLGVDPRGAASDLRGRGTHPFVSELREPAEPAAASASRKAERSGAGRSGEER